jgi:hypothetical protein
MDHSAHYDDLRLDFQRLKAGVEWGQIRGVRFSVHLGRLNLNRSSEWWTDTIEHYGNFGISDLIFNLELTTGDKLKEIKKFTLFYDQLPDVVKSVLSLENDSLYFSLSDVVNISENIGIQVTINLDNNIRYPSEAFEKTMGKMMKLKPENALTFSFVNSSKHFDVSEFERWINKLSQKVILSDKSVHLIIVCEDYEEAYFKIREFIEHKRIQDEFLRMVDSKLRKSENEIWFKPDHDHLEKHLKK